MKIEALIKKYSNEAWVRTEGFIKKDEYYNFKNILHSK